MQNTKFMFVALGLMSVILACHAEWLPSRTIHRVTIDPDLSVMLSSQSINGVSVVKDGGEHVLHLDRNVTSDRCQFKPIKLQLDPFKAYRLAFKARTEGPDTLTRRPNLQLYLEGCGPGYSLPEWHYGIVYPADKPSSKVMDNNLRPPLRRAIVSDEWTEYTDEFYVQDNAEGLILQFFTTSAYNDLWVKDIRIDEIDTSKVININGDFSAGPTRPFNMRSRGAYRPKPEGGYTFSAGFAYCGFMPVREGENLYVQTSGTSDDPRISVEFFDVNGEKVGGKGAYNHFLLTVPPRARYLGYSLAMGAWHQWNFVRIERTTKTTL